MKKITAFFMAIMPIFVTALLFLSGLIVKSSVEVKVNAVEIVNSEVTQNVRDLKDESKNKVQLEVNVLPFNATNPLVHYISSDPNIASVDANGQITCKNYGDVYIYAYADENWNINARCKLEVADTIIHQLSIDNKDTAGYVGVSQNAKLEISTKPALSYVSNPNLNITSSNPDVLQVTTDGTLLPQVENGNATITIETQNTGEQSEIPLKQEINVVVGPGVEVIDLDNPAKEIMSEPSGYNLYNHINIAPETKTNIPASDFTYKCDNDGIAEIDAKGNVKFKAKGVATFHAEYKRDTTKHVSKEIECTFNNFADVYFTRSEVSIPWDDLEEDQILTDEDLTYSIYPLQQAQSDSFSIISSNPNVIKPIWDDTTHKYQFKALQPGTTVLSARILTGVEGQEVKVDNCLVTIGVDSENLAKQPSVTLSNSYYYPLQNNINVDTSSQTVDPVEMSFKLTSGAGIAEIDDNGILHFKSAGTANIEATITYTNDEEKANFSVTCSDSVTQIDLDKSGLKPLEAGVRYKLTSTENWQPTFNGCADKFYVADDGTFIAKNGCAFDHFELKNDAGTTKDVEAVFSEKPIGITSDKNMFETVDNNSWYPIQFKDWANIKVVPSTATNQEGQTYQSTLQYEYLPENETVASIEDDEITFNAPGTVLTKVKLGDEITKKFYIKSTWGKLGKLKFDDEDDKEIVSYKQIELAPGQSITINTEERLSQSHGQQLTYGSSNDLCTVTMKHEATLLLPDYVYFTIKANSNVYGDDLITIKTGTYAFYLRIKVTPEAQKVNVIVNNQTLSEQSKTYTDNLELKVSVSPTSARKTNAYDATINGTTITPTIGTSYDTIALSGKLVSGTNTIVFKVHGTEKEIGKYTINYAPTETPTVSVSGATEFEEENVTKKGLFLSANATQRSALLTTDGFVEKSYWDDITAEITDKKGSEQVATNGNLITLTNIKSDDLTLVYRSTLILKKADTQIAEFVIGKDYVTKIVLPKHDNLDQTDKKGMQKVHVYGNSSWYTKEEGHINYYKLPIDLYDADNKLIGKDGSELGMQLKALAYSTLVPTINQNAEIKYDEKGGFIKVFFNNKNLYTPKEIANNAFDTLTGKNVKFDIHTMSTLVDANYTFVPVEGINSYCQDALKWLDDNHEITTNCAVLQTNFGLTGAKENTPLDCYPGWKNAYIPAIYGNGYTMNFQTLTDSIPAGSNVINIDSKFVSNVRLLGCTNDSYKKHNLALLLVNDQFKFEADTIGCYYSIYEKFNCGAGVCCDTTYKNVVFSNNGQASLNVGFLGNQSPLHLDTCAFLDAGGFPITATQDAPIYFKGEIPVYNFHGQEMLNGLFGQDLRFLWPALLKTAQASYMTQVVGSGREVVNSFMCTGLDDKMYFYKGQDEKGQDIYEKGIKGIPGAADHVSKYIDIRIPFPTEQGFITIEAGLWATVDSKHEQGAPDYWEAYDENGIMLPGFYNSKVQKLCRQWKYF